MSVLPESTTTTAQTLTSSFSALLAEARQLLQPASSSNREALVLAASQNSGDPSSFLPGAIQPLFITAMRCEDPTLCETAVSMLEEVRWKEGAWDSAVMARIARRYMRQKFSGDI